MAWSYIHNFSEKHIRQVTNLPIRKKNIIQYPPPKNIF
jgi:hypothetical protein